MENKYEKMLSILGHRLIDLSTYLLLPDYQRSFLKFCSSDNFENLEKLKKIKYMLKKYKLG